jgi:hypothetical protein
LLAGVVRTYAPCGETPSMETLLNREHLSVMSGVTPAGQLVSLMRPYALRGIEFVNSLFELMDVSLASPDYSTLSKRETTLSVNIHAEKEVDVNETLHIVVDSSGAKVYGEGEWKVRQHGWSKHRTWRKFPLGIDEETERIKAAEVTGNNAADCDMLKPLLQPIENPIDQVSADGAYDKRKCYETLDELGIIAAIPPRMQGSGGTGTVEALRTLVTRTCEGSERVGEDGGKRRSATTDEVLPRIRGFGSKLPSATRSLRGISPINVRKSC